MLFTVVLTVSLVSVLHETVNYMHNTLPPMAGSTTLHKHPLIVLMVGNHNACGLLQCCYPDWKPRTGGREAT